MTTMPAGLYHTTVRPSMDFETYSEAGFIIEPNGKVRGAGPRGKSGLGLVGTPIYAEHPSTEVLCLYYDLKDGKGRRGWMPGTPNPQDLLDYIAAGGVIEAWNVTFEFWIWNMVCTRKYGWPPLPLEQLYCVMAKSRRHSLPGGLDNCAKVLGVTPKDQDGKRLLGKLTRPISASKHRPEPRWTFATAPEDYYKLFGYCDQDVATEDEAAARIPDLTPTEYAAWQLDQRINVRGVQVDVDTLDCMLDLLGQAERKYTLELATLTQGAVGSVSEIAKFGDWLTSQGFPLGDITKDTVSTALKRTDLTPTVRRALEIRDTLGAANIKKLHTLKHQVSSDGRLRDQYTYCGADRTGRASAGGVQLQNITAKGPKTIECGDMTCLGISGKTNYTNDEGCPRCGSPFYGERKEWDIDSVRQAIGDFKTRDLDHVEKMWGDPIAVMCGCLRGLFIPKPGYEFICVDFSAIEAVVAACLARCQWRIDVFNGDGKIYEASVSKVTGIPLEEILQYKKDNGKHHPLRGTLGKIRELAGPYGGWVGAWKNFGAESYFDSEQAIKEDVLNFRAESPEIVEMWGGQFRQVGAKPWDAVPELYGLEGMAIKAIQNPGECFSYIDITYGVFEDVLYCRLPSGRFLHYHRPRLVPTEDKLNRGPCVKITFEGYNSNPTKGPIGWHRLETYGGRLFENVTQATAADIQFDALGRCEAAGYNIVMHTHDEGVAEVPIGWGSVDEMAAIMTERPDWAAWWPIRADGWRDTRYQKD